MNDRRKLIEHRRRARVRATLLDARDAPCVDCGIKLPPECMELDHVRGKKCFNLSTSVAKNHSIAKIAAEIAKCDVRCPNCHRLRHWNDGDYAARSIAGGGQAKRVIDDDLIPTRRQHGSVPAPVPRHTLAAERVERAIEAKRLRASGLTMDRIADKLGIARSTAYLLLALET